ncbi:MAG TPA: CRISPR-associated protein Cas4 [Bacteroidales bacterium]|jgi:CRISPR-associated exonuclease Cas4|nr:CRISPR-associated protein Cas4 [Bacteroidales bacterium]HOL97689.1 CRISPR-associated protein Cas4 [Bacteroidales bacterium]HUM32532.1 CRISPR-associated protein Cas4 [Bacteroidales bacterium]
MSITATYINYYIVCPRKLWLFANGIFFEHTSEAVLDGKLIEDSSYTYRSDKYTELEIDGSKIDFYDVKNKIVHEIKRSDKMEEAHEWQVKYYILLLKKNGIDGVKGILEYPRLRQKKEIHLLDEDEQNLKLIISNIEKIISSDDSPPLLYMDFCKSCSYYDFCYISE